MFNFQASRFLAVFKNSPTVILLLLFLIILRPAPSFKSKQEESESIKGIWMTNVGVSLLHHSTTLDNVFHNLAKSGYNHVYVSTYGLTGTIYPSKRVRSHILFLPPFTDVLKATGKEAKRQNLNLYAWLEYGLMLHPDNDIALKNPEWLLKTSNGETVVNDFVWLNPEHPEVQEYILDIVTEVAQYSNLTGIQLDDHWSVPIQFGHKVEAMNKLTGKVKQRLKKINPKMKLSISPNPYHFSLNKYNQDWLQWARKGYIDQLLLQIYRPTSERFITSINSSQVDELPSHIPVAIGIYIGKFKHFLPPERVEKQTLEEVKKQIKIAENLGYGYSIFCWEYRTIAKALQKF